MKTTTMILGAYLLGAGCGPAFLPDATQKPVTDANVVGTWVYAAYSARTPITISFTTNYAFVQSVTATGATLIQTGSWSRAGAGLTVDGVLMEDGSTPPVWRSTSGMWWLTDSRLAPGTLAIFGGSFPDPDAYEEFRRTAQSTGPNKVPEDTSLRADP